MVSTGRERGVALIFAVVALAVVAVMVAVVASCPAGTVSVTV